MVDWVLVGLITVFLSFIFFLFLMLRRTVLSFQEGMGRDGG